MNGVEERLKFKGLKFCQIVSVSQFAFKEL